MLQRGVGEDGELGLHRLVLVSVGVVVVVRGVGHRDLGLACHHVRQRARDGEETVSVGGTSLIDKQLGPAWPLTIS